jgi:hypothetical protein
MRRELSEAWASLLARTRRWTRSTPSAACVRWPSGGAEAVLTARTQGHLVVAHRLALRPHQAGRPAAVPRQGLTPVLSTSGRPGPVGRVVTAGSGGGRAGSDPVTDCYCVPHAQRAAPRPASAGVVITVRAGAATDVGSVREVNEDSHYAGRSVWLIADGMGGHAAGDVAESHRGQNTSRRWTAPIVRCIRPTWCRRSPRRTSRFFATAVPTPRVGTGDSVTRIALVVVGGVTGRCSTWGLRVYLDGRPVRRPSTTPTRHLVLGGTLTEDEARFHSKRHVITRSLGSNPARRPTCGVLPPSSGELVRPVLRRAVGRVNDPQIALPPAGPPIRNG